MDNKKMRELREFYDTHDTSDEMDDGHWVTEVNTDPMVTTSLRLPKSVLDKVRAAARARGVRPTALMREWIETLVAQAGTTPPTMAGLFLTESSPFARDMLESMLGLHRRVNEVLENDREILKNDQEILRRLADH